MMSKTMGEWSDFCQKSIRTFMSAGWASNLTIAVYEFVEYDAIGSRSRS